MKIVNHEKFNPRLVEWLSSYRRLRAVSIMSYRGFVENLLRDPSEIWRHAYEQEITEAGRSILLAIRSLGGKADGRALQAAFAALHPKRATRYRFSTRPEDFRSGLREVANSFIKPTGYHGFEVIDPSVLDLLNAVIRGAPDNAVDIIEGAASFDQIEQIWTFAKGTSGGAVLAALRQNARRLVTAIGKLAIENRRVTLAGGATGYRGPTYERRMTIIIDMAQRLANDDIAALTEPAMNRLVETWGAGEIAINDGVELLRALEDVSALPAVRVDTLRVRTRDALVVAIRTGCRADELRELLSVIDTSDPADSVVAAARASFRYFDRHHFSEELRECRSPEQFDGLIEDLELFRDELGVDITALVTRVEEAKAEFEEQADAYADHMQDEWKDRYRDERDADRSISDMFTSLRGDRD